ncbi:peptidase family C78-domain-containing protein [Daedaleopsis nitida]|nr:peptidase family C78-domain-containing protein [Daedaleopsis nitida]
MPNKIRSLADDEVELVSHNHPNKLFCQICHVDLTPMTIPQRENHYEEHFSDEPHASGSVSSGSAAGKESKHTSRSPAKFPSKIRIKTPSNFIKPSHDKQNIFWHSSQDSNPPPNFSPGLISVLRRALTRSHDKGATERAWLAFEKAVHICGEYWDMMWGCGYRNYLMACAALMDQQTQPLYFPLLDAPAPPGLRNLQILVERAWKDNYDQDGARQFKYRLVDTCEWIGAGELYVAFTYRGIPAQLVDFALPRGIEPLLQWILDYFSGSNSHRKATTVSEALRGARPVIVTDKLPIILQHQGHSRTIVGCEQVKGGAINLLTFDPARHVPQNIRRAGLIHHNPSGSGGSTSRPTKALHRVMHPVKTMKAHKRKSPDLQGGPSKRRHGPNGAARHDQDVIVLTNEDDAIDGQFESRGGPNPGVSEEPEPEEVLKIFRVDLKQLSKKKKFQILWFPLEEPLSEQEKRRRSEVTSEHIEPL